MCASLGAINLREVRDGRRGLGKIWVQGGRGEGEAKEKEKEKDKEEDRELWLVGWDIALSDGWWWREIGVDGEVLGVKVLGWRWSG